MPQERQGVVERDGEMGTCEWTVWIGASSSGDSTGGTLTACFLRPCSRLGASHPWLTG
jgi:hypothetical protein